MASDLHQRVGYQAEVDELTPADLGESGGIVDDEDDDDDNDDLDYTADTEDNGDVRRDDRELVDPGPFKHNRKVSVAAVPCFILLLAICGETLVLMACAGIALVLVVDSGSKNQRSVVVFMMVFIPTQITILYYTFPLVWVSILNFFLMGLINAFVLMSASWALLQFSVFRRRETEICISFEQVLFSAYPAASAALLTWAASTFIPLQFVPFVLLFVTFVLFQVFTFPTTSSFKQRTSDEDDLSILNYKFLVSMSVGMCFFPVLLQILIGLYQRSMVGTLHLAFICEVSLLISLGMFLITLMSLRQTVELLGFQYLTLVKLRWITGAMVNILLYPVLLDLGISSHFLPWLPFAVAIYASFGALLSYKKYKMAAAISLGVAICLSLLWAIKLPWKLSYTFLFGLSLNTIFVLMLVNSILCLSTAYMSVHGSQQVFSALIILQTIVFIKCEVLLYDARLYGWPAFVFTAIIASYALQRLNIAKKLPLSLTSACMSGHITKSLMALLHVIQMDGDFPITSVFTMFFFVFMVIKMLVNEFQVDMPQEKIAMNILLMCLSVAVNANPVLFILGSYIFKIEATAADATGICFIICGLLIIASAILHMPSEIKVKQLGILGVVIGLVVIVLQPDVSLTKNGIYQLFEVSSIISMIIILYTDKVRTFPQIITASALIGIFPGMRMAILLYPEDVPITGAVLFVLSSICLMCAIFCFSKAEQLGHAFEKFTLIVCIILVILSVLSLILDLVGMDRKQKILSLPSWKLFLSANIVLCVSLKIVISKNAKLIPLHEKDDNDEVPYLPLIGNVTTLTSFLFLCILGPATGILHDVWCCGATVILMCLQNDMRVIHTLKEENQTAPTKIAAIAVLVLASIYRSDLWDSSSWTFVRSLLEICLILGSLPSFYVLWGVLWKSKVILPEPVVVFIFPFFCALFLYGESYTCWAFAVTGIFSTGWMMATHFKLQPYVEGR